MVAAIKTESTATPVVVAPSGALLRAPRKELASALALLARIADRKSNLPILANVLIRACGAEGALLAATDLNTTLTLRAPAWYGDAGDFTVPAKQLADIVKSAPGADVNVTKSRTGCGLRIESGGIDTALLGVAGREFPKVPSSDGATFTAIEGKAFADQLESVLFSVCKDETRFHLNGVYLERYELGLRAVTTDGHRLTLCQRAGIGGSSIGERGVIVPTAAANAIVRLIKSEKGGAVSIAVKAPFLFVKVGGWELAAKLIDAKFPPFFQVIPKDHRKLVTVDRKPLIAALKRAKAMCSDTRGVRLDASPDGLKLTADHPEQGTATESLAAECIATVKVGVNPLYLMELLDACDGDRVTLAIGGELDPIVARATDHATSYDVHDSPLVGVVMPMRI